MDKTPIEKRREKTKFLIDKRPIYLGIWSNIVSIDDRFDYKYLGLNSNDFNVFLYLGKIIFKKNERGILVPEYIPNKITKFSFEGLNNFWLNEINPNALKFTPTTRDENPFYEISDPYRILTTKPDGYKYFKTFYFRSPKNIVLNREQIISYFTELHKLNSTFIKNYVDFINSNFGISSCVLNRDVYMESVGVDTNKYSPTNKQKMIAIEYALKLPQYRSKIPYFSEFFYVYFVYSLKSFCVANNDSFQFMEKNNLIFNPGAYKKYYELIQYNIKNYGTSEVYETYLDRKSSDRVPLFIRNSNDEDSQLFSYLYGYSEYDFFYSPNYDSPAKTYIPSPLDKYYFEIADAKNTFVEFYMRIYPKIDKPPKGWNKEMMRKLDLNLVEESYRKRSGKFSYPPPIPDILPSPGAIRDIEDYYID